MKLNNITISTTSNL